GPRAHVLCIYMCILARNRDYCFQKFPTSILLSLQQGAGIISSSLLKLNLQRKENKSFAFHCSLTRMVIALGARMLVLILDTQQVEDMRRVMKNLDFHLTATAGVTIEYEFPFPSRRGRAQPLQRIHFAGAAR
ncbi:unnamed protein product, partial [Urochloa humidicola]